MGLLLPEMVQRLWMTIFWDQIRDHSATKLALILSLLDKIYLTPARNATRIALQAGGRSHWFSS